MISNFQSKHFREKDNFKYFHYKVAYRNSGLYIIININHTNNRKWLHGLIAFWLHFLNAAFLSYIANCFKYFIIICMICFSKKRSLCYQPSFHSTENETKNPSSYNSSYLLHYIYYLPSISSFELSFFSSPDLTFCCTVGSVTLLDSESSASSRECKACRLSL